MGTAMLAMDDIIIVPKTVQLICLKDAHDISEHIKIQFTVLT